MLNPNIADIYPITTEATESGNIYDVVPYMGHAHAATHPQHTYALAHLRGIGAAPMHKMRVLEIGCSMGSNLQPIAALYPDSEFIGVDPSEVQIDLANENAEAIGLKNCRFYNFAADSITADMGQFDYIISHGVFSWIDDEARACIMRVAQEHLTEKGLFAVSYNCAPGWNFLKSARDLALFHTQNIRDPLLRIQQTRRIIETVGEYSATSDIYRKYFQEQGKSLVQRPDYYIFHEHLEPNNRALYFTEFMDLANTHGLAYVCESNNNFAEDLSVFKPEARQFLSTIQNAVVREQYVDYFVNRQFRSSILCRQECKPDADVQRASIKHIHYRAGYRLQEKQQDGENITELKIRNNTIPIKDKATIALLRVLLKSSEISLDFDGWVAQAQSQFADQFSDSVEKHLGDVLPLFIRRDLLKYWPHKPDAMKQVADKPKVYKHARFWGQNNKGNGLCNYFGESLAKLPRQLAVVVHLMDGEHSRAQIGEVLREAFLDGRLVLSDKNIAELLNQYEEGKQPPRYSLGQKHETVQRLTSQQLDHLVTQAMTANCELLVNLQLSMR